MQLDGVLALQAEVEATLAILFGAFDLEVLGVTALAPEEHMNEHMHPEATAPSPDEDLMSEAEAEDLMSEAESPVEECHDGGGMEFVSGGEDPGCAGCACAVEVPVHLISGANL